MMNLGKMMKQVQQTQQKMQELQTKLAATEVEGQAGGGMVKVTMTGKGELRRVKLDPTIVDPADVGMLEDLVVAACNDARAKSEALTAEETQKLVGGLGLPPGMKLPF
jgi:DNA-binding YbaB/EbfC family protein